MSLSRSPSDNITNLDSGTFCPDISEMVVRASSSSMSNRAENASLSDDDLTSIGAGIFLAISFIAKLCGSDLRVVTTCQTVRNRVSLDAMNAPSDISFNS